MGQTHWCTTLRNILSETNHLHLWDEQSITDKQFQLIKESLHTEFIKITLQQINKTDTNVIATVTILLFILRNMFFCLFYLLCARHFILSYLLYGNYINADIYHSVLTNVIDKLTFEILDNEAYNPHVIEQNVKKIWMVQ